MAGAGVALLAAAALLTSGLAAGLYYAFSIAVLPGLNELPAQQAVAAMRALNRRILRPAFFAVFIGGPLTALGAGVLLLAQGQRAAGVAFVLAATCTVLGSLAPTVVVNVPMNEALAAPAEPGEDEGVARRWDEYTGRWRRWNTVRALACSVSLGLAGLGLWWW